MTGRPVRGVHEVIVCLIVCRWLFAFLSGRHPLPIGHSIFLLPQVVGIPTRNSRVNLFSVELGILYKTTQKINSIQFMNKMALRFAGLGSFVERSATRAAIEQASLSAARRDARSDVAHIAPEVAAAYTLRHCA